jgi:hypothetical protein
LTTISIANDVAKYFAIIRALFTVALSGLSGLNVILKDGRRRFQLSPSTIPNGFTFRHRLRARTNLSRKIRKPVSD